CAEGSGVTGSLEGAKVDLGYRLDLRATSAASVVRAERQSFLGNSFPPPIRARYTALEGKFSVRTHRRLPHDPLPLSRKSRCRRTAAIASMALSHAHSPPARRYHRRLADRLLPERFLHVRLGRRDP